MLYLEIKRYSLMSQTYYNTTFYFCKHKFYFILKRGGQMPSPNIFYLIFRLDKAVVAVFSLINYAGLFSLRVVKYVEGVSEKIHLHDRFLCRHRSIFKLLGLYDDVEEAVKAYDK